MADSWYLESYRPEGTAPELTETLPTFDELATRVQGLLSDASDRILRAKDLSGSATPERLQKLTGWNIELF